MPPSTTELRPVVETTKDYEKIEARITEAFKKRLYEPVLRELNLPIRTLQNTSSALLDAIALGRVQFERGRFTGEFNSRVSGELRRLGAVWDRKSSSYRLSSASLPPEIAHAIALSEARFLKRLEAIEKTIQQKLPGVFAEIKVSDLLDSSLWRVDRELRGTLKGLAIPPDLTPHRAKRIVDEWQENMDLWVKDFAEEEILKLRKDIKKAAFSGNRRESVVKSIQRSFGVTEGKAKFLARQETSLLMTKFKESRYTDSGINEYRWRCVVGSPKHPVRPAHKILDGKIFRWDTPPITSKSGEPTRRNNPGQDFNCRCAAIPILRRDR